MKNLTIVGQPLPNMPWEERPAGSNAVLWRYSNNPVIPRDLLPDSNSIFNSAVVPFKDGFAGVFRCDDTNRRMTLHAGFSKDGINWDIRPDKLVFDGVNIKGLDSEGKEVFAHNYVKTDYDAKNGYHIYKSVDGSSDDDGIAGSHCNGDQQYQKR